AGWPEGPAVLVGALTNRNVEGRERGLFTHVARAEGAGDLHIQVPRRRAEPGRTATLTVRCCEVCLRAPAGKTKQPALTLWAVEAREVHPPKGRAPIHWRL